VRVGNSLSLNFSSEIVAFSSLPDPRLQVAAEIVFVGYGIVAPEYGWDDYRGEDLKGKVALVMVNEPPALPNAPQRFGGDDLTYYGRWTYKLEEAARHGASAALLIHTTESATYPWEVVASSWGGSQYSVAPAAGQPTLAINAWVTDDAARGIVAAGGRDLNELRRAAMSGRQTPVSLGVQLSATLVRRIEPKESSNVIGVLSGRQPDRGVVVTAHYDHLGIKTTFSNDGGSDQIFNGAIDNASGVAGTLAIASALTSGGAVPRRSIYILFTTAEESGLLGAEYFVAHPPLPMAAFAANVNIDELNMFGRARDLVLVGAERSSIREVADAIAARHDRVIARDPDGGAGNFFRSDHFPLARAGVPAVSLGLPTKFVGDGAAGARKRRDVFTEHRYHQPNDEVRDDWSYDGAVDDLRLLGELVWTLADSASVPAYHADDPFARMRANP
jgi:Zn-dependent M28 family amino/carboxypeptidase